MGEKDRFSNSLFFIWPFNKLSYFSLLAAPLFKLELGQLWRLRCFASHPCARRPLFGHKHGLLTPAGLGRKYLLACFS